MKSFVYNNSSYFFNPSGEKFPVKPSSELPHYPESKQYAEWIIHKEELKKFLAQLVPVREQNWEKLKCAIWDRTEYITCPNIYDWVPKPDHNYEANVEGEIEDVTQVDTIARTYIQLPTHIKINIAYEIGVGAQDDNFESLQQRDKVYFQRIKEKAIKNPIILTMFWDLIKPHATELDITFKELKQYRLTEKKESQPIETQEELWYEFNKKYQSAMTLSNMGDRKIAVWEVTNKFTITRKP